ncbi:unnamed protein product [Urochloa decumbens]|uniref:GRF-type domain-containing protein n=1 Tax=Urochloa decumbens TaxID=240449 RepID=A0ABC8Z1X4_9POAL
MSGFNGPLNPPPPHPHLDVKTRSFYGRHNDLPCEFWPSCHHGEEAVVQVYELYGDAGRRFFRCPRFQYEDCSFTYWIDGPLEQHLQEYIRHLYVTVEKLEQENMEKHNSINMLLQDSMEKDEELNNLAQEKMQMTDRINELEERLRQEQMRNVNRRFMPPTVSGRRNYYG